MSDDNYRTAAYVAGLGQSAVLLEDCDPADCGRALGIVLGILAGAQGAHVAFQRGCSDAILRWYNGEARPVGGHLRVVR